MYLFLTIVYWLGNIDSSPKLFVRSEVPPNVKHDVLGYKVILKYCRERPPKIIVASASSIWSNFWSLRTSIYVHLVTSPKTAGSLSSRRSFFIFRSCQNLYSYSSIIILFPYSPLKGIIDVNIKKISSQANAATTREIIAPIIGSTHLLTIQK